MVLVAVEVSVAPASEAVTGAIATKNGSCLWGIEVVARHVRLMRLLDEARDARRSRLDGVLRQGYGDDMMLWRRGVVVVYR